jgi:hypothetical protein
MALQLLRGLQPEYGYDEFESELSHPPWPQSKYYAHDQRMNLPDTIQPTQWSLLPAMTLYPSLTAISTALGPCHA